MRLLLLTAIILVFPAFMRSAMVEATAVTRVVKHVKIYHQPDRFAGWPANDGIWAWGNEILVGFVVGHHKDKQGHTIDVEKPKIHLFARSLDGGESWSLEDAYASGLKGREADSTDPERPYVPAADCPGGINFRHPDFAMTVRRLNNNQGPSIFYYSYDRGRSWEGPYKLPNMGTPGIAARTDYIIDGKQECMLFLTAAKQNGDEGRPFCARTIDGGKSWNFVAYIAPEPVGFSIMPASLRLSGEEILVVTRERERGKGGWLASYLSRDDGLNWKELGHPVDGIGGNSNPPALIQLKDGRLCLAYGVRVEPFGISAKVSRDEGRTWGDPIVLRDDGGTLDLGYCRSTQRPDGKVVTIYYFNDPATGKERHISATIWSP